LFAELSEGRVVRKPYGRLSGHGSSTKGRGERSLESSSFWLVCGFHKSVGGAEGVCPLGRRAQAREGEAGSEATVGRGKALLDPLRVIAGAKAACLRDTQPDP